jgi:hypothetical protein
MASAGLNAVGEHRLAGVIPLRSIFKASEAVGAVVAKASGRISGVSIKLANPTA